MNPYQCSLINDLRGGDHHKRTTTLGGVSHDERCLEAADEIARLREALTVAEDALSRQSWQWTGVGPHPQEVIETVRAALEPKP